MDLQDGHVMAPHLCHHLELGPVCLQYAEHPGTHSIPRQDIQTVVPVYNVLYLAQVDGYGMEDRLPQGNKLLE